MKIFKAILSAIVFLLIIAIVIMTMIQISETKNSIPDIEARYLFIMSGILLIICVNLSAIQRKLFVLLRKIFIIFSVAALLIAIIKFVVIDRNIPLAITINTLLTDDLIVYMAGFAVIGILASIVFEFVKIFKGDKLLPKTKPAEVEAEGEGQSIDEEKSDETEAISDVAESDDVIENAESKDISDKKE